MFLARTGRAATKIYPGKPLAESTLLSISGFREGLGGYNQLLVSSWDGS